MTTSPLTYNGASPRQLVAEINATIQQTGNSVKVDFGADRAIRYAYITKDHPLEFRFDVSGLHYEAHFSAWLLEGADLDGVHQQVMNFVQAHPRWQRPIYTKIADHLQWREHNGRWERELGRNPEKYGWMLMSEACKVNTLTEEQIRNIIRETIGITGIVAVAGDDRHTVVVEKSILLEAGLKAE